MLSIESMKENMLDEIVAIEEECFTVPWSRNSFKQELENKMAIYYVAKLDEKIVGYAGMWHVVTEGHITNIAVLPEYRRKKIGELLLTTLINTAAEKEMIGLTLEVRINNTGAQKLYTKHGFKIEGIRKNYYVDTREDAVIMWKMMNEFEG